MANVVDVVILRKELENRFKHHPPKHDSTVKAHEFVRAECLALANKLVDVCPESRELSLALTHLETVMFWANGAIARH